MAFTLSTSSFAAGDQIPKTFTCDGPDVSPELRWSGAPANALGFALIVDDPDAPGGVFTHWVLFDIPADKQGLAQGETSIGVAGKNDFGRSGYSGPCPPRGRGSHRYYFTLYALDVASLKLKTGAARRGVEAALQGHIVAQAQYMGRYERK